MVTIHFHINQCVTTVRYFVSSMKTTIFAELNVEYLKLKEYE